MGSKSPKSPLTSSEAVAPIPTPTYPASGLFTVLTTTTISAPLAAVVDASLDFGKWLEWNTMIPQTDILSQPSPSSKLEVGTKLTFHSRMKEDGATSSAYSDHEVVSIEEIEQEGKKGWSIVWKTIGIPGGDWSLRAERVQEFVEETLDDGTTGTAYRTWGTFGGPMAYMLSWSGTKNDIVDRFRDWGNDLKAYAEGLERK